MIDKRIKEKQNTMYSMKRKFSPQNENRFKEFCINDQDTNSAFEIFYNKITEIYNEAFPKIKIKMCIMSGNHG